ncbi:GNAT family N-acetyltransferase [Streptacidiphilus fuscans]|uniref:GNAT family N-acetyltransferase n=1 Tax=Streptacidiphilus fuscans TaxID=2789292 RepID=A0A931B5N3_9ACTN|nr:GNAT family N-acetyltransferase [Streptacidiphilus fuscans]MBF9070646.1 GNAT family N-acetyltransferase [Streptacidiphilus fuscans]
MRANTVKEINAMFSRGGDEVMDVTFRRGRTSDAPAMHRLSVPFIESGNLIVRDREVFESAAEDFYVVEIDRTVVACAAMRGFTGLAELYNVAVDGSWQGIGLGRFLLAHVIAAARADGFDNVLVFSKTTLAWFVRHGFTLVDPSALPEERRVLIDPGRGSVPLLRSTAGFDDPLEMLGELAGAQVTFNRSQRTLRWEAKHDSLLQFAEHHGIDVESLCWGGVCGTCGVGLERGTVNYQMAPEAGPEKGKVLLCIARPLTDLALDL